MTNYRRSDIAGASYFFTVNLADRSQSLLTEHIESLRQHLNTPVNGTHLPWKPS